MLKTLIIAGSARNDGDTAQLVEQFKHYSTWDAIDLNDYNISYYDYNHENRNDGFISIARNIAENYDVIVFATPVYWYAMSGILKVFFDRFTDLLTVDKETGRKWRGKSMAVITCSEGGNLGDDFWIPFEKTAEYLSMTFITGLHTRSSTLNQDSIKQFIAQIEDQVVR